MIEKICRHDMWQGQGEIGALVSAWTFGEIIEDDGKYYVVMECMECGEERKDPTTKDHYDAYKGQ